MAGSRAVEVVIESLKYADLIVFVDDCCPLNTGKYLSEKVKSSKLLIIHNEKNQGVGFSTKKGFQILLDHGCQLILKLDADGQMKPSDIPRMLLPIVNNECDATKGNRFSNIDKLFRMPKIRLVGNIFLSYITKFTTGYWDLFDPTNGFIAFNASVLKAINFSKLDNKFFFETDILFRCALKNINIKNVDIETSYGNSFSSLNPLKEFLVFFFKHLKVLIKRIFYQYYILDFNQGSIELTLFFILGFITSIIGINADFQVHLILIGSMSFPFYIFLLFVVISIQLFLSFIYYDCTTRVLSRMKR